MVGDHLEVLMEYVQGTLNTNVKQAWVTATTVLEIVMKALVGVTHLQTATGLDNVSNLTATVEVWKPNSTNSMAC